MHAVLIWDGAGFHTGEDVVVPSNVSLIQLPPYSPELNPVENLWHYLRAHHWSNRLYRDYDALQEEAVRSLCAVREDTETIKTVCNPRYISRAHEIAGKRIIPYAGIRDVVELLEFVARIATRGLSFQGQPGRHSGPNPVE